MGIIADTPDPAQGSLYEKDDEHKLTGFISEVQAIQPFSTEAVNNLDIKQDVVHVFDDYSRNGITSITSMGLFAKDSKSFLLYDHLSTGHPKMIHRILELIRMLPIKSMEK